MAMRVGVTFVFMAVLMLVAELIHVDVDVQVFNGRHAMLFLHVSNSQG
jgi:hypothetical protein